MRVLVTGGAGFIGSHVVRSLVLKGHQVVVIDNLSTGHRAALPDVPLEVADFSDLDVLSRLGESGPFHAVIHLAADCQVGESVAHPERYYRNNLIRSLELLEWARQAGWGGMVFSSSAAVYGEPLEIPITEEHQRVPTNPYGATKRSFEEALEAYRIAYDLPFVSLRYFNAAGADPAGDLGEDHGQAESHLIPRLLTAARQPGRRFMIFGDDYPTSDGTPVRDFVHVCDLAAAHLLALDLLAKGEGGCFNLGNGEGFSVREVISTCARITGVEIQAEVTRRRPGDPAILVASSSLARERLGWRPAFPDLEAMVRTAWAWHDRHPGGFS
ncbi:MAG: UDP-glucose 4-epimerase GalE [Acidobacteriota bacterium]